jgi:TctA family transporter
MRTRGGTISGTRDAARLGGSLMAGVGAVFRHWGLFLRSATIGTVIGMIPGVGGTVASFVAYGHAAQSARDKERFGKGDIRGLIAPEAANDAKDGGALVPVLAFGLPGGTGTAMLLAVLTLHGLDHRHPVQHSGPAFQCRLITRWSPARAGRAGAHRDRLRRDGVRTRLHIRHSGAAARAARHAAHGPAVRSG